MRVLGSTFTDILGLGDQLFTVIVLVVCAGITSHMCFGFGTKKAKETFVALILVLIVGTQFFHLITAVTYIPVSKNYSFDVSQTVRLLCFARIIFVVITIPERSPQNGLSGKCKR